MVGSVEKGDTTRSYIQSSVTGVEFRGRELHAAVSYVRGNFVSTAASLSDTDYKSSQSIFVDRETTCIYASDGDLRGNQTFR